MPVAMEKALERVADKRGLTGKERDAFVYGTMRKAGWKPKREVDKRPKSIAMKTRLDRLIELNDNTSELMEFKFIMDDEEFKRRYGAYPSEIAPTPEQTASQRRIAGGIAAGAGAVGAGLLGQRAINNAGGYSAVAQKGVGLAKRGVDYAGKVGTQVKYARNLAGTLKSSPMALVKDLLKRVKGVRFESRQERIISLSSKLDEAIQFEDPYKRRVFQRAFLGNEGAVLVHGKSGERIAGSTEAYKERAKKLLGGLAIGAGGGAAAGAGVGAAMALRKSGMRAIKSGRLGKYAGAGALAAGIIGAHGGLAVGNFKGNFGKKAEEIYRRRTGQ